MAIKGGTVDLCQSADIGYCDLFNGLLLKKEEERLPYHHFCVAYSSVYGKAPPNGPRPPNAHPPIPHSARCFSSFPIVLRQNLNCNRCLIIF